MLSRFRHVFALAFLLLVASCSGGACSGLTPLPGGFPADETVENAASLRISRPGLDFVEKELPAIVTKMMNSPDGTFAVQLPESPFNVKDAFLGFDANGKFCAGGPDPKSNPPKCTAVVDIGKIAFELDAIKPNAVVVRGIVPLKLDDTPVKLDDPVSLSIHVGYGANTSCNGGTPHVEIRELPLKVTIPIVAETSAPRTGYTRLDVQNATFDLDAIKSDDVRICASCAGLPVCNSILNWGFLKNLVVGGLKGGIEGQVRNLLADKLCTKPNPSLVPQCPTDSSPDESGKHCVFDSDKAKCVSILLGSASHAELGGLLASFSPKTTGGVDFVLGAFGPMNPAPGLDTDAAGDTANGITLGMVGGVAPQPPSKCVPQKAVALPTGIPIPDEIAPSTPDAPGSPHFGVALSRRFLGYALGNLYNSGLFCLNVSTLQVEMLKSGLMAFLIPSINTLTFQKGDAAAAIGTRPQEPPVITLGGGTDPTRDPLLTITLPKLALDFYVWSFDRFVRVFTYTGDITIPVTLQTGKGTTHPSGSLLPTIGDLIVKDGAVSNADTLPFEDNDALKGAVGAIFGTVAKQLLGAGLPPIDLSGAVSGFGLGLQIDAIKKLTKDKDDFIGVFATLSDSPGGKTAMSKTEARLLGKRVWPDHLSASTYARDKLPELDVALTSSLDDGNRRIEYAWWIDSGTRSPWSNGKHLLLKEDQLFFQGRHVLHVTSRVAGDPATEDASPAEIPYVIDAVAPFVTIEARANDARIEAWDLVSDADALRMRYRVDDGAFGPWGPLVSRVDTNDAQTLEVEVKDEEGNVASARQALRGPSTSSPVGCDCSTAAASSTLPTGAALSVGLAVVVLTMLRRRGSRRALIRSGAVLGGVVTVAMTSEGCGDRERTTGCGSDCTQFCQTGLGQGQPGAYLSVTKAADGSIWAAGYNDALLSGSTSLLWGDLVVGRYDLGKQAVQWETVDGVPTRTDGTCPAFEPHGWRNGETGPGDDVGRWTSIQLSTKGEPFVSYYDVTSKRLKFATHDGGRWKTFVLKERDGADIGKYSKMLLVDGKPVIAYMHLEPGNAGRTRTKISLARATAPSPDGPEDFTFEDIAVDEDGPCRAGSCAPGEACIAETGTCTVQVSGCSGCGERGACITKDDKPACARLANAVETYPRGIGAYISLAKGPQGLGLVAYDGYRGNLVAFVDRGTTPWQRVILDGETGSRADGSAIDTGNVGISASLAIDTVGTWHVSYVGALDDTLRYVTFDGSRPGRPLVVDDGTSVDGKPHADGKHLVGDDSSIRVERDVVTIFYADSSSLGLRRATGVLAGGGRTWELHAMPDEGGRWLAFPQVVPDDDRVAVWWRRTTRETSTVEGNVVVLTP